MNSHPYGQQEAHGIDTSQIFMNVHVYSVGIFVLLRRTSTRARTRLGRVAEANYHFGILSADKCRKHCSLCIVS